MALQQEFNSQDPLHPRPRRHNQLQARTLGFWKLHWYIELLWCSCCSSWYSRHTRGSPQSPDHQGCKPAQARLLAETWDCLKEYWMDWLWGYLTEPWMDSLWGCLKEPWRDWQWGSMSAALSKNDLLDSQ